MLGESKHLFDLKPMFKESLNGYVLASTELDFRFSWLDTLACWYDGATEF